MSILAFKKKFDKEIKRYLEKNLNIIKQLGVNKNVESILEYYNDYILAGGKRMRPYIFYLIYMGLGGKDSKKALQLSMSFEIMHDGLLIHDDIMDKGTTRHGLLSFHKYLEKNIYKNNEHLSVSSSILAGNVLFGMAFEIMSDIVEFPLKNQQKAREEFFKMFEVVNIGQFLDMDFTGEKLVKYSDIKKKTFLKTASYTFIYPMRYAVRLLGLNNSKVDSITKLGTHLGLAMQMRDDLWDSLGLYKDKTPFSDIQAGQHTVLTDYVLNKGTLQQKKLLNSFMGKDLSNGDKKAVVNLLTQSGAVDYTKSLITKELKNGRKILESMKFKSKGYKDSFLLFIDNMISSIN